jgi:hypothetical protein
MSQSTSQHITSKSAVNSAAGSAVEVKPAGAAVLEDFNAGYIHAWALRLAWLTRDDLPALRRVAESILRAAGLRIDEAFAESEEAAELRAVLARQDAASLAAGQAGRELDAITEERQQLLNFDGDGAADPQTIHRLVELTARETVASAHKQAADRVAGEMRLRADAIRDRIQAGFSRIANREMGAWLSDLDEQIEAEQAAILELVGADRLRTLAALLLAREQGVQQGGLRRVLGRSEGALRDAIRFVPFVP